MGMPQDFETAVRAHGAMIRRIAASYEADRHLAEDLVQDILFALWRAWPGFRGQASARTFIARIAVNRAISHVARALRTPRAVGLDDALPAPGEDAETRTIARDREAGLLAAVRRLPLANRQIVTLTLEGLTPADIAEYIGLTVNAVAIRLTRAKHLLRRQMGDPP